MVQISALGSMQNNMRRMATAQQRVTTGLCVQRPSCQMAHEAAMLATSRVMGMNLTDYLR